MHANLPDDDWAPSRPGYPRYGRDERFGQPAPDSRRLAELARAYEEQIWRRQMSAPPLPPVPAIGQRPAAWLSAVVSVVLFVLLLAMAIGLAVLSSSPW
jgi:hypothetical protein